MKPIQKKQILILSDGSILKNNKTYTKTSYKIKTLTKDHKTFLFNKKNKNLEYHSNDFDSFKSKFLKF